MNFYIFLLFLTFAYCTSAATKTCPKGFQLFKNKKCLKLNSGYLGHREAEADCRTYGGHLVTVDNAADNMAITNMASNYGLPYIWMGIFCFGNSTDSCYMDDGSGPLKYTNFKAGFPRIDSERSGCVFMETFGNDIAKWSTSPCEWTGLEYVCEVPTIVADSDPSCTHNYNGYCYYPSHELQIPQINRTYLATRDVCKAQSMHLVSIHSRQEVDYIKNLYWHTGIQQVSLGARADVPGVYSWSDGTKFTYSNMDPLSTSTGNCLIMEMSGRNDVGMWAESNCQQIQEFMCRRKSKASSTAVQEEEEKEEVNVDTKEHKQYNPKFQISKELPTQQLDISSHCNETLYLAPGVITSLGYPSTVPPSAYCFWKVAVLGQYRLGLYYTDFSVYKPVIVYSSNGTVLSNTQFEEKPFKVLAPDNIVTITHDSLYDASYGHHGFSATVLPF